MKIQTYHWHAWWTFYWQAGSKKMPSGHLLIMPHAPLGGYSSQSISKWKNMRSSHQKQGFLEICFILVLACLSYSCNPKKHILQTNISNMSSSCLRKTNMIPFGYTSSSKPLTRLKTWMAITIKPYSNHSSVSFIQTQEVMSVFFHNTSHHVYTKSRHWMDSIGICRIQSAASSILVNANLMVWALQTATLKSRHQVKRPMPKAGGFFFWCTNLTQTGLKLIGCTFCFRNLNGAHFSKKV